MPLDGIAMVRRQKISCLVHHQLIGGVRSMRHIVTSYGAPDLVKSWFRKNLFARLLQIFTKMETGWENAKNGQFAGIGGGTVVSSPGPYPLTSLVALEIYTARKRKS